MRVKDNYYVRGEKGLYLALPPTFGFDKTPATLGSIKTSVLMPNTCMPTVQFMYDAYRKERTSLGDIAFWFVLDGGDRLLTKQVFWTIIKNMNVMNFSNNSWGA